jgi:hypothetical protein
MIEPEKMTLHDVDQLRIYVRGDLPPPWGSLAADAIAALLADREWHRRRVKVEPADVSQAGVTWAHVQAWARSVGGVPSHETETPEWAEQDAQDDNGRGMMRVIIAMIRVAHVRGYAPSELDVLEAMAAMEVGS